MHFTVYLYEQAQLGNKNFVYVSSLPLDQELTKYYVNSSC